MLVALLVPVTAAAPRTWRRSSARRCLACGSVVFCVLRRPASSQYMPAAGQVTLELAVGAGRDLDLVLLVAIARAARHDVRLRGRPRACRRPAAGRSPLRPRTDRSDASPAPARCPCRLASTRSSVGVPAVTKVSTRPSVCVTFSFLASFGTSVANVSALPRQRLASPSCFVAREQAFVDHGDACRCPAARVRRRTRCGTCRCTGSAAATVLPSGAVIARLPGAAARG